MKEKRMNPFPKEREQMVLESLLGATSREFFPSKTPDNKTEGIKNKKYFNKITCGDSLILLKKLERDSIDLVITSPPYFGCRQYGNENIGRESNPLDYVNKLLSFTGLIKNVMKKTGSFYLVIGDVYFGTKGFIRNKGKYARKTDIHYQEHKICKSDGRTLQHKQLLLLPSRVAIRMQEEGWILRNDIIWHKPNAVPSFSRDRRLPRYEHIFHFVKGKKYYFDYEKSKEVDFNKDIIEQSVKAFPEHQATFPLALIEKLIVTTSKEGDVVLDPFAGYGTTAIASRKNKRNSISFEINERYVEKSRENFMDCIV